MDCLSSHKMKIISEIVESVGANVVYLPPYSPDLNPIEMAWSKIKSVLRALKPRTQEEMQTAIVTALDAITKTDAENWFLHDGYFLSPCCVNV